MLFLLSPTSSDTSEAVRCVHRAIHPKPLLVSRKQKRLLAVRQHACPTNETMPYLKMLFGTYPSEAQSRLSAKLLRHSGAASGMLECQGELRHHEEPTVSSVGEWYTAERLGPLAWPEELLGPHHEQQLHQLEEDLHHLEEEGLHHLEWELLQEEEAADEQPPHLAQVHDPQGRGTTRFQRPWHHQTFSSSPTDEKLETLSS